MMPWGPVKWGDLTSQGCQECCSKNVFIELRSHRRIETNWIGAGGWGEGLRLCVQREQAVKETERMPIRLEARDSERALGPIPICLSIHCSFIQKISTEHWSCAKPHVRCDFDPKVEPFIFHKAWTLQGPELGVNRFGVKVRSGVGVSDGRKVIFLEHGLCHFHGILGSTLNPKRIPEVGVISSPRHSQRHATAYQQKDILFT